MFMSELYKSRFDKLNNEQKQAVESIYGPTMVIAGPGAGKTELLSLRIANILSSIDVNPEEILCVTFTDAAASNLKERLASIIGPAALRVNICTFHSFAQSLISSYRDFFKEKSDYQMCDDIMRLDILTQAISDLMPNHDLKVLNGDKYLYINDISSRIDDLKRAGMTASDFKLEIDSLKLDLDILNSIVSNFFENLPRLSKKVIPLFDNLLNQVSLLNGGKFLEKFKFELFKAIEIANETQKTKTLSAFKKTYIAKDQNGVSVLKDSLIFEKQLGLFEVYSNFENKMDALKLYDYTDMLLWVLKKLKTNEGFLRTIQERYQFVMVDEYQDTSMVQLEILKMWAINPFEQSPNLFVVGDDDQAIYKFSGASIDNILEFKINFPEAKLIELNMNYRSHQDIIDLCANTLKDVQKRLCNISDDIKKVLNQGNQSILNSDIKAFKTEDFNQQKQILLKEVRKLIDSGVPPNEIAVIARNNRDLIEASSFFISNNQECYFEYALNVLEHPKIIEFFDILNLIHQISIGGRDIDYYLFKSVFHSYHNFTHESELAAIKANYRVKNLKEKFLNIEFYEDYINAFEFLAQQSKVQPLRVIISRILDYKVENVKPNLFDSHEKQLFFMDFDVDFAQNLQVLIKTFETQLLKDISLTEFLGLVNIYKNNNKKLSNYLQIGESENAVAFLSAHKSKGLEYEHVFVLEANEKTWLKPRSMSKLNFASHLNLKTEPDDVDDCLKILYVAFSRAKKGLTLLSSKKTASSKTLVPLSFVEFKEYDKSLDDKNYISSVLSSLPIMLGDVSVSENDLISDFIKKFRFSPSSLLSYFDLTYSGPEAFWQRNICKFQSLYSEKAEFGRVIHAVLETALKEFKKGQNINLSFLEIELKKQMQSFYFDKNIIDDIYAKALKMLDNYSEIFINTLNKYDQAELMIQGHLSESQVQVIGIVDRIKVNYETKTFVIIDYKTGRPVNLDADNFTAFKHRMQVSFYKELMKHHVKFYNFKMERAEFHFLNSKTKEAIVQSYVPNQSDTEVLFALIEFLNNSIETRKLYDVSKFSKDDYGSKRFVDEVLNSIF